MARGGAYNAYCAVRVARPAFPRPIGFARAGAGRAVGGTAGRVRWTRASASGEDDDEEDDRRWRR